MLSVHTTLSAVVLHRDGLSLLIGMEPADMRAFAADLAKRADEVEASAADAADAALARAGGRA